MTLKGKILIFTILSALVASVGYFFVFTDTEQEKVQTVATSRLSFPVQKLRQKLSQRLGEGALLNTETVTIENDQFEIEKTINTDLESYVKKRLRYYRPDKSAVVVIDNNNGEVITAVGYDRKTKSFDYVLPFTGTHPSASIFKIVTSAELLEDDEVAPETKLKYRGKGTTLYKYQLKEKKSRWTRNTSFERAFAFSNNVIFGKVAINQTTPHELKDMAERLGFNESLMSEINLSKSTFIMPEAGYNLAEIASGFNKKTQMSPVHCAVLSSIIANDGVLVYPRLVNRLHDLKNKVVWENEVRKKQVINKEIADEVSVLMSATVNKGTARRKFRRMNRKLRKKLEMGGKTGSITGGFPMGKRDWFTAYAKPKNSSDRGISVCVMNINFKKWYVKSTRLTQEIIQYYYKKVDKI
jgi:peptidoglycan glycosyltransferase